MVSKCIKSLLVAVFSLFLVVFSTQAQPQESHEEHAAIEQHGEHGKLDPAKVIKDHIKDGYEFHFFQ
jgi:F-type H+-transporting ATPase subunit a